MTKRVDHPADHGEHTFFEVEKSVDTKKVNAYVTGVGKTKRIVLWDTLLARLTPPRSR